MNHVTKTLIDIIKERFAHDKPYLSEEKRIAKDATVDASNWKSFVELERINKVAMKIK